MPNNSFLGPGVVHVHPSLRCNLACSHCYSASSVEHVEWLDPELMVGHLRCWIEDGYEALSVSGGEPLLYKGLVPLLQEARQEGLQTRVITNGFSVSATQVKALSPVIDVVAVSIDGDEQMHDEIRRAPGAFNRALDSLRRFRDAGISVAVVSCVTKASLSLVPTLHDLCVKEGIPLLSLRPVVRVGRAIETLANETWLNRNDLRRLAFVAKLLDETSAVRVRTDAAFAGDIRRAAHKAYPFLGEPDNGSLAHNVNPLVINERGTIVPYVYGLNDLFALGNIRSSREELMRARAAWLPRVESLVRHTFDGLPRDDHVCVDWFAEILQCASNLVSTGMVSKK